MKTENINVAIWSLHLFSDCPNCNESIDLLDAPDFWDGVSFTAGEHMTPATTNVTVYCPKCGYEFKCDFTY